MRFSNVLSYITASVATLLSSGQSGNSFMFSRVCKGYVYCHKQFNILSCNTSWYVRYCVCQSSGSSLVTKYKRMLEFLGLD